MTGQNGAGAHSMRLKLKFFSLYRDAVGSSEAYIDVPEGYRVYQVVLELVKLYPKLAEAFKEVKPIVFVNGEVVDDDAILTGDDIEMAFAPPASGGVNVKVRLFSDDVSLDDVLEDVVAEGVGAVAIFVGTVKGVVDGRKVYELVYEAYEPYVIGVLERIAKEAISRHNLHAVHIYHRTGLARPGQKTVVIAVSAKGRKEALEAVSYVLERVKSEAPIYKLERREDGEYWVVGDGKRVPRAGHEGLGV